jgi:uncharacterized membrane protein YvlD (DUF360 family)
VTTGDIASDRVEHPAYGDRPAWRPERPRLRPARLALSWILSAATLLVASWIVPGVDVNGVGGAFLVAALIAVLNAALPPVIAGLRLPYTVGLSFVLILLLDALLLQLASAIAPEAIAVDAFGWALLASLLASAVGIVLEVVAGTNDDDAYALRVVQRIAGRAGDVARTSVPGIVFLEIDGLALPVLRRAMRDGSAPQMASWLAAGTHRLAEWETDLSSQTGASQAGILLGSNRDIPAFRWVEKERGVLMTCSAPADCAEIERRHATGVGLLTAGGASRGNLLSGEADEVILTVSRVDAERRANPGYRAFYANGFNVTRTLVLIVWEVILEWTAALRAIRRDVRPRGHRGGTYPLLRAAMCVAVRDLVVFGVLGDMMAGRPAVYATFASYDEVAHHSGLERADTLEALRKLDQQFGRIHRARRYAPRPYEIVVLSDHGQTQGATFLQRNGYGLEDLVRRSLDHGEVAKVEAGDENDTAVATALDEATGRVPDADGDGDGRPGTGGLSGRDVVVLGSGNLGLIYLMEEPRRLLLEEIEERHPDLIGALRAHPHIGFTMVRSRERGALALGPRGTRVLDSGAVEGEDPLASFSPTAARHLLRTDGFANAPDILVNSFYDPELDEGCAFEELISFHGGMGGSQTRPFIMHPAGFPLPDGPIVGAEAVHGLLAGWRAMLQGDGTAAPGR